MENIFDTTWSVPQVEVMQALRDWAVAFTELNQQMAAWLDLPTTDANALGQVLWAASAGEPLSPARLGQLIGMTSGSVTVLVDRLEGAGLIARSREHTDRRRVTLRPTAAAEDRARAFAERSSDEIAAVLRHTDDDVLRQATLFLRTITGAATASARRLRGTPPPAEPER
ncbi:MarR family transcriptional regulator [Curtobacterium sp. A7_M15]|uniref:MarR family winged helix-turn-helix transcriptional regulator n=1 Tax=Curtobacterium sp. A7_M15 TaxID=3065241 RepID=UPI002737DCB5|nr:MarR family transcriptional regulator [Curtobacterium sp. A7_M15]MDP4333669.1 MarR family transcriptional regulator [Curtobacterium sp. A7_M15]